MDNLATYSDAQQRWVFVVRAFKQAGNGDGSSGGFL